MVGRLLQAFRPRGSFSSSSSSVDVLKGVTPPTSLIPSQYDHKKDTNMDAALKRLSIGGKHPSGDKKDKKSPRLEPQRSAKMDMILESPPLLLQGTPQQSTGALFAARLKFEILDPAGATFEKFEARLELSVSASKPVEKNCHDCSSQVRELKKWEFFTHPVSVKHGEDRQFPISFLFPGHLPATTKGHLAVIDYSISARATTSTGEVITFRKSLDVKRALMPGNDKHSVRVFPPTNLTAHVTIDPIVHPIGDFPVHLRLSGVTTKNEQSQVRWRLRKLNWRIEEMEKMIVPACPKHSAKLGGEGKGILREEEPRTIGQDEVKVPWKSDFEAGDIECEFHAAINPRLKSVCDVEAENGLSVTHQLVLEMVVAEEWAPNKRPSQATPTGAARVLRTHFSLNLTERLGLGISWDEEQPPMYEDVPASPPRYKDMSTVHDYDLNELGDAPDYTLEP